MLFSGIIEIYIHLSEHQKFIECLICQVSDIKRDQSRCFWDPLQSSAIRVAGKMGGGSRQAADHCRKVWWMPNCLGYWGNREERYLAQMGCRKWQWEKEDWWEAITLNLNSAGDQGLVKRDGFWEKRMSAGCLWYFQWFATGITTDIRKRPLSYVNSDVLSTK